MSGYKYSLKDHIFFMFTFHQIIYISKFIFIIFKNKCENIMEYVGTLGLLTLILITVVYFACFVYTLKSYLKNADSAKIYFMVWCI